MNEQINLRLPKKLIIAANNYAKNYGFKNVQDLAAEALREKVFEESEFDESFSDKEIELIEKLTELSVKKGKLRSEKEIFAKLE